MTGLLTYNMSCNIEVVSRFRGAIPPCLGGGKKGKKKLLKWHTITSAGYFYRTIVHSTWLTRTYVGEGEIKMKTVLWQFPYHLFHPHVKNVCSP